MPNDLLMPISAKQTASPLRAASGAETGGAGAQARQGHGRRRAIRFGLEVSGAKRVSVVGTFNNWDPEATPLRCVAGTRWFVYLPVEIGRHEYRFVVDGKMVDDPRAKEFVPAAQSGRNAVLQVVSDH
jgi:1,4-alpha-glucan branching enzyme